jgi:hypothetical protein
LGDRYVRRPGRQIVLQTYGAYIPVGNFLAGVAKVFGKKTDEKQSA